MNDFYTRLMNGETPEEIAASMTKDLNEAIAKVEKDKKDAGRRNAVAKIVSAVVEYIDNYMPDLRGEVDTEELVDDLFAGLEAINATFTTLKKLNDTRPENLPFVDDLDVIKNFCAQLL